MDAIEFYYSDVLYKIDNSVGWNWARLNGNKEVVEQKCKQYGWIAYRIFGGGGYSGENFVEPDELKYYPTSFDAHLLTDWIYWEEIDKWFLSDEKIPYPTKKQPKITDEVSFEYCFENDNVWQHYDVTDEDDIYVPVEFTIATKYQKTSPILELDKLYDEFENFIEKLKTDDFAYLYVVEFWEFKFLAWVRNDKIRLLIQDYANEDRNGSEKESYVPIVFDILTDKEKFIENFESCYKNMKKEGLKIENKLRKSLIKNSTESDR